ncbi:related to 1-acyl-sn-glycerol-3-phosphate acyltransferase delta [Lecanosticta acicola]|uniref:Related to 1-acyl-sn-glycerol-3-phosphate acyltransferase delta n=1 Tax=Lecanosticta acicola TaxID=111012 RepID=A0AAI8Z6N6_9PEZI|nr:related to 1-acyl-sn-glycerol-3-phosphate acyltransferase delta [Lecanosticta acicola]
MVAILGVVGNALLGLRVAVFTTPWLLHLFLADILLSALLPISAVAPGLAYDLSSRIAESVWRGIQFIFTGINRAQIIVSGAENLPRGESAIVIANHVEWTDFYLIQEAAIRCGMLGRCRWFAKQQLKWIPFLGWGLWAMGMPLVSRKWTVDQREMDRVFQGVLQRKWPMWLVSYSEATRYTPSKRAEAEKWGAENNKSVAQHLLYPRSKGFIACVQKLRGAPHVKAVYDMTIAYAKGGTTFQSPPSFWQSLMRPRLDRDWTFYIHVERHDLQKLPREDVQLAGWLEERWLEKGERLERLNMLLAKNVPWESETAMRMLD